jgi:RNA exonuclease 4
VRDTALYPPLMSRAAVTGKLRSRALRHLVTDELGAQIQVGEHCPVQDARAALYLYHKHR